MTSSPPPHIDRRLVAAGVLDTLPARFAVLAFDTELRFVGLYGHALRRVGWEADAVLGRSAQDLLGGHEGTAELVDAYRDALRGRRSRVRLNQDLRAWDIEIGPLHDGDGQVVGGIVVGHDTTPVQQARRLHDARARAAKLIAMARDDLAGDLVREVAPVLRCLAAAYWEAGADGRLRPAASWVSDGGASSLMTLEDATRARSIAPGEDLVGRAHATGAVQVVADLRAEPDGDRTRAALDAGALAAAAIPALCDGRPVGVFEFYAQVPIEDDPEVAAAMSALVEDIAHALERRARVDALQELADQDGLTGLLNRRRFEEELRRHGAAANRYGRRAALLVVDLDDFKAVNDRHGHAAGDELLRRVADVLRGRLRASDCAARLGGDEFAVILDGASTPAAELVGEHIAADLAEVRVAGAPGIRPSASIGVAAITRDDDALSAFEAADRAMYAGKRGRRR